MFVLILDVELLEVTVVLASDGRYRWHCARSEFDPGQPLDHIAGPTAGLSEFTITDDVDAHLRLLAHDLGNRISQGIGKDRIIDGFAVLACLDESQQFRRPDQAADMRRQDAAGALGHGIPPSPPGSSHTMRYPR